MSGVSGTSGSVLGVVLAGGASRRMGRDKASLEIDGTPMLVRVADALRAAGAAEVVVAGASDGARSVAAEFGLRVVEEPAPGAGPVSGISAGLRAAVASDCPAALIVACDLPSLDARGLASLTARLESGRAETDPVDVVVARGADGIEPLVAAWSVSAASTVDDALAGGGGSVRSVLDRLVVLAHDGLPPTSFINLNTPEDASTLAVSVHVGAVMSIPEISVDELAERLAAGARLVDVREVDEWLGARVPGVTNVVLGTIPDRVAELEGDGPLHLICKAGGRSMQAAEFLAAQGMDVVNVAGGTDAWISSGRDVDSGPAS